MVTTSILVTNFLAMSSDHTLFARAKQRLLR
jgi:hypothetical protein